jgi:hypothetical protein
MATSSDESFLARWSRLKRRPGEADGKAAVPPPNDDERLLAMRAPDEALRDDPGARDTASEDERGEAGEAGEGAKVRDFSDFDFETLDYESDYTQFMGNDVPDDARNKALRQLWVSNPVLANMDGLDDYCEDYTDAAVVPIGGIKTAYKIGRGFLSDTEVAEWEALGRPEQADVALADTGEGEEAQAASEPSAESVGGDDAATTSAEATAEEIAAAEGVGADAASAIDLAACPGAACAAAVNQEEEAALAQYEAEQAAGARSEQSDDAAKRRPASDKIRAKS